MTGPIARSAQILAGHGFVVAVPEVYHELLPAGTVLTYTPEDSARGNACKVGKSIADYDADIAAAVGFLAAHAACTGRVGAAGVCLGGGIAFRAALHPGVRAAACWYPTDLHKAALGSGGDDSLARAAEVKADLLIAFGRQDPHVPLAGREMIKAALEAAGCTVAYWEPNGAHAFLRDENSFGRYDAELALLSYQMMVAHFRRTLGGALEAKAA